MLVDFEFLSILATMFTLSITFVIFTISFFVESEAPFPSFRKSRYDDPITNDKDGDDEVYVVVYEGKAYDYSTDDDVVVQVQENGIVVEADEGSIRSSNLTGPYVVYDLKGKLGVRAMTQEDEKFLKSKFDLGIKPRNNKKSHNKNEEQEYDSPEGKGWLKEKMVMRQKEHKKVMDILKLEHEYWKKLFNYEFGKLEEKDNSKETTYRHRSTGRIPEIRDTDSVGEEESVSSSSAKNRLSGLFSSLRD